MLDPDTIPADFVVQPVVPETPGAMTCGTCGLSWDDSKITSMTPAPSGRCPFEYFHVPWEENSLTENTDTVDLTLVLSFEPDAIRGHYEGDDPDPVAGLTDDELRVIGHEAIADDRLYRIYCQLLEEGVERTAAASGGEVA